MKRFVFPFICVVMAVVGIAYVLVALSNSDLPSPVLAGSLLVGGMLGLVSWVIYDLYTWTPPSQKIRTDNGSPDVVATREWVEKKVNAATAGCLTYGGPAFSRIATSLEALEAVVNGMCEKQLRKTDQLITDSIPMAKRYFLSHQEHVPTDGPANNPASNEGFFEGQDTTKYFWSRLQSGDVHVQCIFGGEVMFSFFA